MDKILELKKIINESNNIVVFTGAGISTPSNIPDFRSSKGLYVEKYQRIYAPESIISHTFYVKHPDIFFKFYKEKMVYPNALPNEAHYYFAELEKLGKVKAIITQNIDGLHQKAGSKKVIELHGSVERNYCEKCHKFYTLEEVLKKKELVPKCSCSGTIKPDVVLYEESLDYDNIKDAVNYIENADTLIIVGTSLVVEPAASFVYYFRGKHLVVLNKSKTKVDDFGLCINDDIINIVKELKK